MHYGYHSVSMELKRLRRKERLFIREQTKQAIRMEEKELARFVRRIQNGKEKFPFYAVVSLDSPRPGAFPVHLWLISCNVGTAICS